MDTENIELKLKKRGGSGTRSHILHDVMNTYHTQNVHTLRFVVVLCDHWQSLTFRGNPWYTLAILGIP